MNFSWMGRIFTLVALLFVSVGCSGSDDSGIPEGSTEEEMRQQAIQQSQGPDGVHGGGGAAQHGGGGSGASHGAP